MAIKDAPYHGAGVVIVFGSDDDLIKLQIMPATSATELNFPPGK